MPNYNKTMTARITIIKVNELTRLLEGESGDKRESSAQCKEGTSFQRTPRIKAKMRAPVPLDGIRTV